MSKQHTDNGGGWVLWSSKGQLRETGRTSAAPPAISRFTFPEQHRPKNLSTLQRDIQFIEIKHCEDTVPQNQLRATQEQHKDLCKILRGASATLHIIQLEMDHLIHSRCRTSQGLGLHPQRVKKLA